MTTFAVSLYDPANASGAFSGNILACVQAAANNWAAYIPGYTTLNIVVNFVSNIGSALATGGSSYHYPYSATGITTAQSDPISKVVTGVDPNGPVADLYININTSYVSQLFYDASSSLAVPSGQFDAVSVFAHEIGHGLGINGFRDGFTGVLTGTVQSTFDQYVTTDGVNLYFNGANAQRVYGGPVPLEYGDYGHIGNYAPRPGSSLISDLMFGVIQAGTRQYISQLDLAIMQDIGMPIAAPVQPAVVVVTSPLQITPVTSDFNGDRKTDLLWRQDTGATYLWNSNGAGGYTGVDLGLVPLSYQIAGTGDFNGDGKTDILWRGGNGDVYLWNSNGAGGFAGIDLGIVPTDYQIAAVGDFNGDGKADILWRGNNGDVYQWNSNGAGGFVGVDLGIVPAYYQIAVSGDFNGDGKADILWRASNGDAYLWNSNGSGGFVGVDLGIVPIDYQIAGTGDFNGDGKADILWRASNGDTYLWNSNGAGSFSGVDLGIVPNAYQIVKVGDYNGDGKADILWRGSNGDVYQWLSNGAGSFVGADLGIIPTSWVV